MILNSILGSSSLFRDESFNYLLRARPRVQAFIESMVNVFWDLLSKFENFSRETNGTF